MLALRAKGAKGQAAVADEPIGLGDDAIHRGFDRRGAQLRQNGLEEFCQARMARNVAEARAMLMTAFMAEVADRITHIQARELAHIWLERQMTAGES